MPRLLVSLGLIAALAACASAHMPLVSSMRVLPGTDPAEFHFESEADVLWPADSDEAEADRVAYLEQLLQENDLCPNGYVIDRRDEFVKSRSSVGAVIDLHYYGRCL